jgi:hypothetical protein
MQSVSSKGRQPVANKCRIAIALVAVAVLAACDVDAPVARKVLTLDPFVPPGTFCSDPCAATVTGLGGVAGQPLTISLEVDDQNQSPVPGVSVSWYAASGNGSTDVTTSVSDSIGHASVHWTLDTLVRTDSLRASLPSGVTVVATVNARHGAVALAAKIMGDAQSVAAGATSSPFIVRVTDRYGNPVGGVAVAWALTGGNGDASLGALTTTTDPNGVAQTSLTTGAAAATYRVIATFGLAPAVTFTLTSS